MSPVECHQSTRLVKTRIVATVGPACESPDTLRQMILAGADVFRLNFAHPTHEWLSEMVSKIRDVAKELRCPVGILADLSGPKIRLGGIQDNELNLEEGSDVRFVQDDTMVESATDLTCSYDPLIGDVKGGDRILLADGTVGLRVTEQAADRTWIRCRVEQGGVIRSRQGVNLPGVSLSTPSLTEKDFLDLEWALSNEVDFVGLSFVRSAADVDLLREAIRCRAPKFPPLIVAKIEKTEAVDDLEAILAATDIVMVARGDLGVEAGVIHVPILQKKIIRRCNDERIPVITATQMLDSMQTNELPTRAEASDVANAVIDGTDAVMLSGETAIGINPVRCVDMMNRIAREAEPLVQTDRRHEGDHRADRVARPLTEAVTLGASTTADFLGADLIVVATETGRTALALSRQRGKVPVLALTENISVARRMSIFWGVTVLQSRLVSQSVDAMLQYVIEWGRQYDILRAGSRIVVVGRTRWFNHGHDTMIVHVVPDEANAAGT